MYIVEGMNNNAHGVPNNPIMMGFLSRSASLEQWHRCLTHCSPSLILEMVSGNLVNSLDVTSNSLQGNCEDYILGCQTRQPFDGTTKPSLDPLELVSWGPSRVQSRGGRSALCQ